MSRRVHRRGFLTASLGVGVLGALAACGAPASPTAAPAKPAEPKPAGAPTTAPASAAKPAEPTKPAADAKPTVAAAAPAKTGAQGTITFWGHENHPVPNAIPGYEQRNPGMKVKYEALGDWLVKFKATLASGTDVPDLIWASPADTQDLGSKGMLLDVTEIVAAKKDQLAKGKLTEVQIHKTGRFVAVPGDIGLSGLWYRQDVVEKVGVKEFPKDLKFDDCLNFAAKVKKDADAAAFVFPKGGYNTAFQILLSQNGGSVTSLDGATVTIDDDKGVAAMTQVKQLWDTGAGLDAERPAPTYWAAVKGGKLASDFSPAWYRGFFLGEMKSPADGLGQWRVIPMPTVPSGVSRTGQVGGASLISTKFTKFPDQVRAFQDFAFMTLEGATAVGSWGIIPSFLPYLDSPAFQNQTSPVFGEFLFSKVWAELAKELSPAYQRTAVFNEAMTMVTQNMMPIMRGEVPVKDGMKKIGDQVRQANSRYQ
jgi:lactose/L-arabinose transport system substrate-binding protein